MFSTRAGTYASLLAYCSLSSSRSAVSIAAGVVSCALQTPSSATRSDCAPVVSVGHQGVRLFRSAGSRLVLGHRGGQLGPGLQDRVDDPPLRLDLVVSGEQGGVAAHGVHEEP